MMVAAMNPCPCGYLGNTQRRCRCTTGQILHYRGKISGPLLDRIDIHVEVGPISEKEMLAKRAGEPSAVIRRRVTAARGAQQERFAGTGIHCNAQMSGSAMDECCSLTRETQSLLRFAIRDLDLSARAYDRILRVARTLADLDGEEVIGSGHITEAIQYRCLDRQNW
jgi:magnesium chelatase family protein